MFTGRTMRVVSLLAMLWAKVALATEVIGTFSSDSGGAYAEVIASMRVELKNGNVDVLELKDASAIVRVQPRLAVAVGAQACQTLAESERRPPLLCTLLPKAAFENIAMASRLQTAPLSALWLDQPTNRQIDLIRLALPQKKRLGVLLGSESASFESALIASVNQREVSLTVARVESNAGLSGALLRLLADTDVLLAVPNSQLFNGGTIQNILRATIARRVPTVGFSPAYVRAGAAMALYSTPTMIGTQTGQLVRRILSSGGWPAAQPPRDFEIGINTAVMRSLGLDAGEPATLKRRLELFEDVP